MNPVLLSILRTVGISLFTILLQQGVIHLFSSSGNTKQNSSKNFLRRVGYRTAKLTGPRKTKPRLSGNFSAVTTKSVLPSRNLPPTD
jgi:hypothetical protein